MSPHSLLELRREALDPAVERDMVDLDTAVDEHALEVAVADWELQIPPHRPEDHLSREAEAAEGPGVGHARCSRIGGREGAPLLPAHGAPLNATDPLQEIVLSHNLTPRKCLGFLTPLQALLGELGRDVRIRFA